MIITIHWKSSRYARDSKESTEVIRGTSYIEVPTDQDPDEMEFVWDIEEDMNK